MGREKSRQNCEFGRALGTNDLIEFLLEIPVQLSCYFNYEEI